MSATAAQLAIQRLLGELGEGKTAALARAVSVVENHRPGFETILAGLHAKLGRARRIGITGPPGAGKSTLTTGLVRELRAEGHTVGIIAVDPTSPFTGGALLGDRVRMEAVALDDGVYIRSMATRGSLGGLASSTREVADVLDGFGFDRILIETVGVGQTELDIARTADSSVVVLVPESGDSIQTLKAGLMEIADIFVVNKSDRPGADRLRTDIGLMLALRSGATMKNIPAHHGVRLDRVKRKDPEPQVRSPQSAADSWTPPVLRAVASQDEGIADILASLDQHFHYLEKTGGLAERRRRRMRERVVEVVEQKVRGRLWSDPETIAWIEERLASLESGAATPFDVADELLRRSGNLLTGKNS
jgi:LAO/AO transport system kinase